MALGLIPGIAVLIGFLETGLVPRLPSAVLAAALELAGMLLIVVGLLLSAVARRFAEVESRLELLLGRSRDATRGPTPEQPVVAGKTTSKTRV
jgi:hypothetical protein